MTVVSAVITQHFTAHASDSLLTEQQTPGGSHKVVEQEKPKLVCVRHWRGALAYWGLAEFKQWSTFARLQHYAQHADEYSSPEEFANAIAADLNSELSKLPLPTPVARGIGIHFTAYERLHDYWIPELFLISNWANIEYTEIRPGGVGVSRETYHTLMDRPDAPVPSAPDHREFQFRMLSLYFP